MTVGGAGNRCRVALSVLLVSVAMWVLPLAAEAAPAKPLIEVVTVPPVAGARFVLDGREYRTDQSGVLKVRVAAGSKAHSVSIEERRLKRAGAQYTFVRWFRPGKHEQDYLPKLTGLRVRNHVRVMAAFRVSQVVSYGFADESKRPVERERVSRVEFRGHHGQTAVGDGSGKVRLLTYRPQTSAGTVVADRIRYTVQRVDVDGSNVVHVNRQVFVPGTDPSVLVTLLLRTAHFSTRDFLFGGPVGQRLQLTYPNGEVTTVQLDTAGKATVESLARGSYSVRVDAPGYSFDRPLALSRNQYVDLPVITYFDMGVIGAVGVGCVALLYVIRVRRGLVMFLRSRRHGR